MKPIEFSKESTSFENKVYWGAKHGKEQLLNNPKTSPAAMGLGIYDIDYSSLYSSRGSAYRKDQIIAKHIIIRAQVPQSREM